ncbi:MAG: hypothetical protein R3242_11670, partial [Akkermansiaceae bacterium]|nr:hypothetical protein [Akkermansiaceae bacterium]
TGEPQGPFRLINEDPLVTAAFGLLDRKVDFEEPFYKSIHQPLPFGNQEEPVEFFGVKGWETEEYRKHVRVLAYRPIDGSHALEVSCKGADDKLVLYRPAKPIDFATACRWVRQWREEHGKNASTLHGKWNDGALHSGDTVKIPYITLENTTDFADQLQNPRKYPNVDVPGIILRAEQMTRFKLTEKGAEARVEVSIETAFGGGRPARPVPRQFIYDKPFFVFLWREKADWPYLGVWIGDTSALHPKK